MEQWWHLQLLALPAYEIKYSNYATFLNLVTNAVQKSFNSMQLLYATELQLPLIISMYTTVSA